MSVSKELTERGFIHQFSAENITEILDGPKRTIYHGVDPSADSIHAGNFAAWMMLRHLAQDGHKIILLIGGGTGMIGDPKPDVERPLTPPEEVAKRVEKLQIQAKHLLQSEEIIFVNNHDWLGKLNLIDFLRDTGKHFTVNELIKKEAIAKRLAGENGLSYTEFAYPLLQAYDYLVLHNEYGCDVQVGGSDQWGNIVAGVDLVRKKEQHTVHAITIPLIVDKATGKKFGKSEGNAVWLDAEKTTPYEFYQFWLNVSDENVVDYLKIFTFHPLSEIAALETEFKANPGSRLAQKTLARTVTEIVHGEEVAKAVEEASAIIFGEATISSISDEGKKLLLQNVPTTKTSQNTLLLDLLVETELATSKREARTFIESGAVTIGEEKISDLERKITKEDMANGMCLLRRGKKHIHLLTL